MRQDGDLASAALKVWMVFTEDAVESIELHQQTMVNLVAVEGTRVVHDVHEGAVEEGPQATQVAEGQGVDNVAVQLEGISPFDGQEFDSRLSSSHVGEVGVDEAS